MGLQTDNNPIQLSRMNLEKGKRLKTIAPLSDREQKNTATGDPRYQGVGARHRATGYASGTRGVNTRLENTGRESKLVDISYREISIRRRRAPNVNLMRTPMKQGFAVGERPTVRRVDRTSNEIPLNHRKLF